MAERSRHPSLARLLPLILLALLGGSGCKKLLREEEDPIVRQARQLAMDQHQNDERIWSSEVEALAYEASLDAIVDAVRLSSQRLSELKRIGIGKLNFRLPGPFSDLAWGVEETHLQGAATTWDQSAWESWISEQIAANSTLDYFRLRLVDFRPGSAATNGLDSAIVSVECHVKVPQEGTAPIYHMLKGELAVTWDLPSGAGSKVGRIVDIVVENLRWRRSASERAFEQKQRYAIGDPNKRQAVRIAPVIVRDLDGDLLPDIIMGGVNLILRNEGNFVFKDEPLLAEDLRLRSSAVAADFTGDGHIDLLGFLPSGTPVLVPGDGHGKFLSDTLQPWSDDAEYPSALAVADVDDDGDLDVWMTQNRPTYHRGALPVSINDANDGFPSRMYRNEGDGTFTDITAAANLGTHRSRRTPSASFIDIDNDHDPDLIVASDYAGIELYTNDGTGVFTEATQATFKNWHLLAQSTAIGRFDGDDRLDFFIGGRWSTAMQRIDGLQLERSDFPDLRPIAAQMTSGNQLLLSQRGYEMGPFNADAKNTGWTTSATTADFDNDDDDDLYLTAGHVTGHSVSDFDSQFWRHDIYLADGISEQVLNTYLQAPTLSPRLAALKTGEISWYGYEPNRLEVNTPQGFADLGYLHGTGLSQDSPAATAADLNLDGRMDLLCIAQRTFPQHDRLAVEQSLVIYGNALKTDGHWLGVHLVPNAPDYLPISATVRLYGDFGVREAFINTGFTPMMQGPTTAHFGLGKHEKVEHLSILWGNGREQIIAEPELDRYLTVRPRLDFTPIPDPPMPTSEVEGEIAEPAPADS